MPAAEGSHQAAVGEVELEKLCQIHASALVVERVDNQCVHGRIGEANGRGSCGQPQACVAVPVNIVKLGAKALFAAKVGRLVDLPFAREVQSLYQIKDRKLTERRTLTSSICKVARVLQDQKHDAGQHLKASWPGAVLI